MEFGEDGNAELDSYINDLADIDTSDNSTVSDDNVVGDGQQPTGTGNPADKSPDGTGKQAQVDPLNPSGQKPQANVKPGEQPAKGAQTPDDKQLRPLGDGTFADKVGNIVAQDGTILAEKGFAARIYNQNRRMKDQLTERTEQLNQLSVQVGELKSLATSIQHYGLDNTEVATAMDLAGRMKRGDHLGVAKEVLALVVAQGYNVTDLLGKDVGDSIETRAIQQMIDQRLAPITRQEQDRQQQTEAQRKGKQAYDQFVSANEYADVHSDAIVSLMQRENVNPQAAYNRLYKFAVHNNLDFSQPLGPQIEAHVARQTNGQQQQPPVQQQQPPRSTNGRPMPNGAATRHSGAIPTTQLASADDDWGSIISEVQRSISGH